MSKNLLLQQFDLLATAPGGVAKLRELILTLAVQGKLVPQDPADEPASELLKRIRAEKDRLIAAGKIKRDKQLAPIGEDEQPFGLPKGWEWVRLEEISLVIVDCPHSTPKFVERGRLCLDTNSFKQGQLQVHKLRYVDQSTFAERNARLTPEAGDLVFAREGSVGESIIIPNGVEACLGQRVMLFRFSEQVSNEFVRLCISSASFLDTLLALHKGIGAKHVNVGDMRLALIPLSPLPEQARIVSRVEELMRVCDALEAKGQQQASHHRQLVQTLLGTFTDPDSATPTHDAWQRVAAHFDTLLDRPSAVDALEQTILQLAVRGQLVPQDPTDEPASELLKRIRAEKDRLIAAGKIKRDKPLAPIGEDEQPFALPQGWEWMKFGDLAQISSGVTLGRKTPIAKPVCLPYLRVANVQRWELNLSSMKEVVVDEDELPRFKVCHGDLLITEGGDWDKVGRTAIWRDELPTCLHQNHVFKARGLNAEWNPVWAELYLNSEAARSYFAASAKQTTNLASINMTELKNCAFPLPPLPEQTRIVARVAHLRRLCVELRQRLTQSQTTQAALAEALVATTF